MKKIYLLIFFGIIVSPLVTALVGNFTIFPDGVGSVNTFTGVSPAGLSAHWWAVNETVINDTSYIYANLRRLNDTFSMQNITLPANSVINNLTVYARAIRLNTTRNQFNIGIVSRTSNVNGSVQTGTSSFAYYSTAWLTDPSTGTAWDESGINYTEIGARTSHNSTGGGINISQVYANVWYTQTDSALNWSSNSTNSTYAGQPISHNVLWTDTVPLSGYIFSFDNGNGTLYNDTWVGMTGTTNWSNVSKVANSTGGSTIRWIVYVNDSSNNKNVTSTFQYTITPDTEAPQWQNPSVNDTNPLPTATVRHNINWTDNTALSFAILEVNSSGASCNTLANVTNTTLSGASQWANLSWQVSNACEGKTIGWKQYANDSLNQWNVTSLQTYNVQNVAPTITLPVYVNATKYKNSQSMTFNLSVIDTGAGASYCSVNVNGNSNQTLAVSNGWCNGTYALTEILDGNKTINAYANDSAGNLALNNSYVVWIDTTSPTVTLPVYTNLTAKKSTDNLLINASVTDSGVGASYCRINIATATASNVTVTVSNGWCNTSYSLAGSSEGNQIINVYANDTLGNIALNNSYSVKIDNTPPTITLPVYVNATSRKNTDTLTINISVSDSGSGTTGTVCLVDITGTNQSLAYSNGWCNSTSISLTGLTDGNKTIKVYANDTVNNFALNNSYVVFMDSTIPQILFITGTETNATSKNQQFIFANVSVTETNFKNITYKLFNSSGPLNQTTYTTLVTAINWTNLNNTNVQYWYNVSIYDTANNFNQTETRYLTLISNQAPSVTILYPENITYNVNVSQLNYSANDDDATAYCWYSLNGGTINSTPSATCSNFTGLTSNQGSNTWIAYVNDSLGAENSSNITFFKDTIFPQFSNHQRNISTPNEDQAIQVNVTVTETNKNYTILEFNRGTLTNYTVTTNVSNEYYFTIKGGNYTAHDSVTYYWYANDTAGNMNKSSQQGFTVSNQIPSISAPAINDTTPETNDLISCNGGTFSDNDAEDTEQNRYFRWYDNDIEVSGQTSQTLGLSASGLDKTDIIKCSARVYDGYDNSSWTNSSNTATIQNSAPSITTSLTTISWDANGSVFNYDYNATDIDDDSLIWYDNTSLFDINSATGIITDTPIETEAGTYAIRISANDGTVNATDDFTYTIDDITNPNINFQSPTETSGDLLTRNYIQVNVTATDDNLDTITIYLYNSTDLIQSNTSTTSPFFINYTGLSADTYFFNATANDTLNNKDSTETRNVSLTAPTLTIILPENKTYITGTNLQLNFTVSLQDYILYNLDDETNTTISENTTFNTTSGLHTLYLFANNSIGTTQKNVTFTVNLTKFKIHYNNYWEESKGNSTNFNASSFEDIQNLSNVVLENTNHGKIEFAEDINLTDDANPEDNEVDFDSYINISSNRIEINTTALPNLNKSATLYLYGLAFSNPRILMDGSVCPDTICTEVDYSGGTLIFNVTQFTIYSSEETPVTVVSPGGGGKEPGLIPECTQNSECSEDEICLNHQCIKLFDIKIIDFESPAKLGEFFDFTYYIKGEAKINADVEVKFWIEKDGEIVTSGSDTIYLGNFEERTETTKIFLPSTVKSGIYEFYIEVIHPQYSAQSHRTIEIQVKNGAALVGPIELGNIQKYIIMFLISLSVIIVAFIVYYERKKIRLGLVQERKWIRKHKISVLIASLVLVIGLLLYFLGFFKFLAKEIVKPILWLKINLSYFVYGILILGLITIIVSILRNKKIRERFRGWRKKRKIEKFFKKKYTIGIREAKKEFLGAEKGISKGAVRFSKRVVNFISKSFSKIGFLAHGLEKDIKKTEKDSWRTIKKTEKEIPKVIKEIEKEVPKIISEFKKDVHKIKIPRRDLLHFISLLRKAIKISALEIKKFFKKSSRKRIAEKSLKEGTKFVKKTEKEIEKFESVILKEEKKISKKGARFVKKTEKEIDEIYEDLLKFLNKLFGKKTKRIIIKDFKKYFRKNEKFVQKHLRTLEDLIKIKAKDQRKIKKKESDFLKEVSKIRKGVAILINDLMEYIKDNELIFAEKERRELEKIAEVYNKEISLIENTSKKIARKTRRFLKKSDKVVYGFLDSAKSELNKLFRKPDEKIIPTQFEEKPPVPEEIQPEEIKEKKDKDIIFDIVEKEKKQKEGKSQ